MDRRAFITMVGGSILSAPFAGKAQQTSNLRVIGFLGPPPSAGGLLQAFQQGLRDLGYIEGQNIRIEYRYTDVALQGHPELFPQLAAELVQLKPAPAGLEAYPEVPRPPFLLHAPIAA